MVSPAWPLTWPFFLPNWEVLKSPSTEPQYGAQYRAQSRCGDVARVGSASIWTAEQKWNHVMKKQKHLSCVFLRFSILRLSIFCFNLVCCSFSYKWSLLNFVIFFFKDFIYLFLDRGERREKEGEQYQCVGASHTPSVEDLVHKPQACALTGNRTSDPLFCRPAPNPLSHTSQGLNVIILLNWFYSILNYEKAHI